MKKLILIALVTLAFYLSSNAQKVAGFIGDWHPVSEVNRIQYDKLTDVFYAFMYTTSNGTTSPATAGGYTTILQPLVTQAHANGVKVHISLGGARHNSAAIASAVNPTNRANLITNIISAMDTYDLDGFNMDWEFPSASHATDLGNFMTDLKTAMDNLGASKGKYLELSAAVAPLLWNTDGINQEFIDACDYIEVMAFDAGGNCCVCDAQNHSSQEVAINTIKKWTDVGIPANLATCGGNAAAMNVPIEKLVLAIPFYSNSPKTWASYKNFMGNTPEQYFNDADGVLGSYGYNSKPMIEAKVDLIMNTYGGAGVWCWELADDRDDQYSLLSVMWDAMQPHMCPTPQPDLGNDVSICGFSSITLNSSISTASGRTFTWKKGTQTVVNNNANKNTYSATTAGTYTVIVSESNCSKEDQIEILGTLPSVDLGADQDLCSPSTITLDAGLSGNVSYEWKQGGSTLADNTKTLEVNEAATYTVTVSDNGGTCNAVSDQVTITSSLVEASGDTRCGAGTVTLTVNESNGTYNWYGSSDGNDFLSSGETYEPTVSSDTYFYVEKEGAGTGGTDCSGVPEYEAKVYSGVGQVIFEGELWQHNWYASASESPATTSQTGQWTLQGSCSSASECDRTPVFADIEICTGTSFNELALFQASPNPTNSSLTVSFNKSINGELTITTTSGQQLIQERVNGSFKQDVDLSELPNGMYILLISSEQDSQTLRIVKQ